MTYYRQGYILFIVQLARVLVHLYPHHGRRPLASTIKPRQVCCIVLVYVSISDLCYEDVEGGVGFLGDIRQRPIRPPTNEPPVVRV